jgi:hypothetical protein
MEMDQSNPSQKEKVMKQKVKDAQEKAARSIKQSPAELEASVASLIHFANGILILAEDAADRMTMGQVYFFLMAASRDLKGDPTTFTEIRDQFGDKIGKSLHSTYRQLLKPARTYPKALGWLDRWEDPMDQRRKYLKLTPKGKRVARLLLETIVD